MTLSEFKAWFEGFCEGVGEAPTPEQWAKIKAKVADMGGPVMRIDRPDAGLQRTYPLSPTFVSGGTGSPLPDRGQVIAKNLAHSERAPDRQLAHEVLQPSARMMAAGIFD